MALDWWQVFSKDETTFNSQTNWELRAKLRETVRRFEVSDRVEPAPRGGRRASKVDQDLVHYLMGKVSENLVITLKTLKEQTHADLPKKQIYGRRGLKVELYEVPERYASSKGNAAKT